MSRPDRPVDKFGFPIPVTFNEPPAPRKGFRLPESPHSRRAVAILAGVVMLGILVGPWLVRKTCGIMAAFCRSRAQEQFIAGDLPGALENIDRAVAWRPDDRQALLERAEIRLANRDLDGALADANTVLAVSKNSARAYGLRSTIHHRRGEHVEAIQDATAAIKNSSERDPQPWNHRAYYRALAGLELNEALTDIQHALDMLAREEGFQPQRQLRDDGLRYLLLMAGRKPAFLDTRGFVFFKLEDYAAALPDFNEAIKACEKNQQTLEEMRNQTTDETELKFINQGLKSIDIDLSVMYHHRGETQEKLGNIKEAKDDLAVAQKLGYDPDQGIE